LRKLTSFLKVVIPLGVGLFFIFLTINATTSEERNLILNYIKTADYRFVLLSVFFGILSHLSRAYRWKFLLAPMGYTPRFINSTLAVLSNVIPRGERPVTALALRRATSPSQLTQHPLRIKPPRQAQPFHSWEVVH